jgi:hypothetical protein
MICTITGADDKVDVRSLLALSEEFPFVEWGILRSEKREGTPRYPSAAWQEELRRLWLDYEGDSFELAAHLCGEEARKTVAFGPSEWVAKNRQYRRMQINGFTSPLRDGVASRLMATTEEGNRAWIFQARSEATLQEVANDAARVGGHVLYDPSGGRGVEPFSWPVAPFGCTLGYAGGIGPDNIEEVLRTLPLDAAWIDMESKIRNNYNEFCLTCVREVLEAVAKVTL